MISIISPVYNMEKYLEDCIKSILSQDYADFEVLFVNDGSSDSTLEILRKYEQQDSRIRVFDKLYHNSQHQNKNLHVYHDQ